MCDIYLSILIFDKNLREPVSPRKTDVYNRDKAYDTHRLHDYEILNISIDRSRDAFIVVVNDNYAFIFYVIHRRGIIMTGAYTYVSGAVFEMKLRGYKAFSKRDIVIKRVRCIIPVREITRLNSGVHG